MYDYSIIYPPKPLSDCFKAPKIQSKEVLSCPLASVYMYIYIKLHTYMHTCIHAYMHTYIISIYTHIILDVHILYIHMYIYLSYLPMHTHTQVQNGLKGRKYQTSSRKAPFKVFSFVDTQGAARTPT